MKAINKHDNQSVKFPIYCREFGYFEPALFIDTRNGEVYADRAPRNSCSEAEWKGSVKRIVINGNFLDDDDVSEFIDSQLDRITEYLNSDSEFTDERIIEKIKTSSFDWNEERVICESFSEYCELCNIGVKDAYNELNAFNYDVSEYARSLVDGDCYGIYFKDCTYEEIEDEIKEYLKL